MPRRQQFWHRRSLIIAALLALAGIALGTKILMGHEVGPVTQVFTWSLGGASITITLCDWRKVGKLGNAQFQMLMLGLGAVLVELFLYAAAAAAALVIGAFLLSMVSC